MNAEPVVETPDLAQKAREIAEKAKEEWNRRVDAEFLKDPLAGRSCAASHVSDVSEIAAELGIAEGRQQTIKGACHTCGFTGLIRTESIEKRHCIWCRQAFDEGRRQLAEELLTSSMYKIPSILTLALETDGTKLARAVEGLEQIHAVLVQEIGTAKATPCDPCGDVCPVEKGAECPMEIKRETAKVAPTKGVPKGNDCRSVLNDDGGPQRGSIGLCASGTLGQFPQSGKTPTTADIPRKCLHCSNTSDQGKFVEDVCYPCYLEGAKVAADSSAKNIERLDVSPSCSIFRIKKKGESKCQRKKQSSSLR